MLNNITTQSGVGITPPLINIDFNVVKAARHS